MSLEDNIFGLSLVAVRPWPRCRVFWPRGLTSYMYKLHVLVFPRCDFVPTVFHWRYTVREQALTFRFHTQKPPPNGRKQALSSQTGMTSELPYFQDDITDSKCCLTTETRHNHYALGSALQTLGLVDTPASYIALARTTSSRGKNNRKLHRCYV